MVWVKRGYPRYRCSAPIDFQDMSSTRTEDFHRNSESPAHKIFVRRSPKPSQRHDARNSWVAVKELELRDYPPIMENQMEKKMENEMETGGI